MIREPLALLRRIPVRDNGEPLVDILAFSTELLWADQHPVFEYERARLCRAGLARRLARAQAGLPPGLRFRIVEGWRSPEHQRMMYLATWEEMRKRYPTWSAAALRRLVNRFSAPPEDPRSPPPHVTGGAVDLSVVGPDGAMLDFTSPFAPTDRAAAPADAPGLSDAARANRRMMAAALLAAGITRYDGEWWHWSFGDQGWALRTGASAAIYGPASP